MRSDGARKKIRPSNAQVLWVGAAQQVTTGLVLLFGKSPPSPRAATGEGRSSDPPRIQEILDALYQRVLTTAPMDTPHQVLTYKTTPQETVRAMDRFLADAGFLEGEPTL